MAIVYDCTVSGLHLWGKHLVEEMGWMMLASQRLEENTGAVTVDMNKPGSNDKYTAQEVEIENASREELLRNEKREFFLYKTKIDGYKASIRLFALKLQDKIEETDSVKKVDGSTKHDLEIINRDYIAILQMFMRDEPIFQAGGSKTKQHGGKKGSKKSSKSSKKPSSKKSSVSKTQPSPKKGSKKGSRKGSKKSAKKH